MNKNKNNFKGIRLKKLNVFIFAVTSIICLLIQFYSFKVMDDYRSLQDTMASFRDEQKYETQLRTTSNYLSKLASNYVITGATKYLYNYYDEADSKSRVSAIMEIKNLSENSIVKSYLDTALDYSSQLEEMETQAFLLALEGYEIPREEYPKQLADEYLTLEDRSLSNDEKISKASSLLKSNTYQASHNIVISSVDSSIVVMTKEINIQYEQINDKIVRNIAYLGMLTLLLLLSALSIVLINSKSIINPISSMISSINNNKEMEIKGANEIRYLADTYNQMYEKIKTSQELLLHDATHDALTGLENRKAYTDLYKENNEKDICYILVDADNFKLINDTYGHDMGDKVLKKIAEMLTETFNGQGRCFRLGGDEFAAIMLNVDKAQKDRIKELISTLQNKAKGLDSDEYPPFTFSIGVAFSGDEISSGITYKDADLALYEAKKSKNKAVFYNEI